MFFLHTKILRESYSVFHVRPTIEFPLELFEKSSIVFFMRSIVLGLMLDRKLTLNLRKELRKENIKAWNDRYTTYLKYYIAPFIYVEHKSQIYTITYLSWTSPNCIILCTYNISLEYTLLNMLSNYTIHVKGKNIIT